MRYCFGDFELDVERHALTRAGERLALRPKVFDMLAYLVARPDVLVTKQELLDALWEGQHVGDTTVPWTIGHARRVLGQGKGDKAPIETVHRRGYRFRGQVEVLTAASQTSPPCRGGAPFVGREAVMANLTQRLTEASHARGGLCLLSGDAGMGKTRCLSELSVAARGLGFSVWSGRAVHGDRAPVYYPFLRLLMAAADDASAPDVPEALRARMATPVGEAAAPNERDAVLGRFALFDMVASFLSACGQRGPRLLLIDDLQWADEGTLDLLEFVASELYSLPILLVGATRPSVATDPVAGRLRSAHCLELAPLDLASVQRYVSALAETATPEPAFCEALYRASAGYPLFLEETLRSLQARHGEGGLDGLSPERVEPSEQVRTSLRARFDALPDATGAFVACASVLGESFDVPDLTRLCDVSVDQLLPALDDALRDGFIVAAARQTYRFRHALFREAAYDSLGESARVRTHRTLAQLRECGPDAAARRGEIAYHYHRSLAQGDPARVRAAACLAAEGAEHAHSYGDAARFYGWAVEAQAMQSDDSPRAYAELLTRLAHAQRCGGATSDAQKTVEQLVAVAGEHGYGDLLLKAARTLRLTHAMGTVPDRLSRTALQRALELLPESQRSLRLQARSLLTWLPPVTYDMARCKAESAEVLRDARQLGTRDALSEALIARLYALRGPDDIDALLSASGEMFALDDERRGFISVEGHTARHCALLYRGDLSGARAATEALAAIADRRGFLDVRWHCDRHRAQARLLAGDLAGAEAEFARLHRHSARLRIRNADAFERLHRNVLGVMRRGPHAFELARDPDGLRPLLKPTPAMAAPIANLARACLAFGHTDAARRILAELSADDFAVVPRGHSYLNVLCALSVTAVTLGDRVRAEQLYAALSPYPEHNTPEEMGLYEGAVAHFLGVLDAFFGRVVQAEQHFAQALSWNTARGLRPLAARTRLEYARLCLARGQTRRAEALQADALSESEALGLSWLSAQTRALGR